MHPFPIASTLGFLVGAELEAIHLSRWQITFQFDQARINVESMWEHVDQSGVVHRYNTDETRNTPLGLSHLFNHRVQSVETHPDCMTLFFDAGDSVRIYSDNNQYECGQIYHSETLLTVF